MLDMSEQGLALQAPEPLPSVQEVPLRFVLPGTAHSIEAIGQVIWSDQDGRAGMFFSRFTPVSRKYLKDWLNKDDLKKQRCSAGSIGTGERAAAPASFPVRVAGSTGRRANHLQVLAC